MKRIIDVFYVSWVFVLFTAVSQAQVPLSTEFFFPHIVDGTIEEEEDEREVFRTLIIVNNPNGAVATGTLTLLGNTGTGLVMSLRCLEVGGPCTSRGLILMTDTNGNLAFTIPAQGFLELVTARSDPTVFSGYARVTSDIPISGSAIFAEFEEEFDEGEIEVEIEGQAGVSATGRMTKFAVTDFRKNEFEGEIMGVEFEFESESATGLAVVDVRPADPLAMPTTLTLTEFDASGTPVGMEVVGGIICDSFDDSTCSITLAAGEHLAFFLSQAITVPEDFVSGTVIVESSDGDITAVALKFDDEIDDSGDQRNEFTVSPVIQLAP